MDQELYRRLEDIKVKLLLELFFSFAKIGLFTFGGGYSMLPLIERTCVEKKKWLTGEEMLNAAVLADSTPGPVAVNCATYVGYKQKGVLGALAATLGVVVPSFAVILAISFFLERYLQDRWVAGAFKGIKIAVGILIVDAAIRLFSKLPKKASVTAIMIASCAAMLAIDIFAVKISSVVLMLLAAAVGLFLYLVKDKRSEGRPDDLS